MRRAPWITAAVIVAVPVAGAVAAHLLLSPEAIRDRVVASVERATGRTLTIAGPVSLGWSLTPTVSLSDVSLANPQGFSRPALAHIDRLEVAVALVPLLSRRVEIEHVSVAGPDVRLERDAQGRGNWVFAQPAPSAPSATPTAAPSQRFALDLGPVSATRAKLAWAGPSPIELSVPALNYDPKTGAATGTLSTRAMDFALSGTAGPIAGAVWPLALRLQGSGLDATLSGNTESAGLAVQVADLATLSPLAGRTLPTLHDIRVAGALSPAGIGGLQVQLGQSTFGPIVLRQATLSAPSWTGPADLHATLAIDGADIVLTGQAAALAALLTGPGSALSSKAEANDAVLEATGTASLGGTGQFAIKAHAGDLAHTAAGLPSLRNLQFDSTLAVNPGTASLTGMHLTTAQGDLAGDLVLTGIDRPTLRGTLTSSRLDLDALAQAMPGPAVPASTAPAMPAAAPPPHPTRIIPETRLPFDTLRRADLDLQLRFAQVVQHGQTLHDLAAHLLLQDGHLHLDPASVALGDQRLTFTLDADAGTQVAALKMDGANLPAAATLGQDETGGTLDLHVDLHGQGDTTRAMAATLSGHAGVALVDAEIGNAWLEGALIAAKLPINTGGRSHVRCAAFRVQATAGRLEFGALTLDTSKLKLDGTGSIDLASETLDLHLTPQLRVGTALSIPVRVRGTLAAPNLALDPGAISPGRVGILLGGPPPADTCDPALTIARGGQAGPAASAPPVATPVKPPKPADLLRSLLR